MADPRLPKTMQDLANSAERKEQGGEEAERPEEGHSSWDQSIQSEDDDSGLPFDALGKAFFYGPKVDLAASDLLAKRFTMKGIRERVAIVDNHVILTFVKEHDKNIMHSPYVQGLALEDTRPPKVSSFDPKTTSIELGQEEQTAGKPRYYRSRESAINHMVYYFSQSKEGQATRKQPVYKKIDLNKYNPKLISSDDQVAFGVSTSPVREPLSPLFFKGDKKQSLGTIESPLIAKHIRQISPFQGSMLDEIRSTPWQVSRQTPKDKNGLVLDSKDMDVDIVELKNVGQEQIREIINLTIEERSLLGSRINHLTKRLQVLEQIVQGNDEETEINNETGNVEEAKKASQMSQRFVQDSVNWMLKSLISNCKAVKATVAQLLANGPCLTAT